MKEKIKILLQLKEQGIESELVEYLNSLSSIELKKIYSLYFYAKEIEVENYNKTFLEFQEKFKNMVDNDMVMELGNEKILHALIQHLENIEVKVLKHEQEIEKIREKKRIEEERQNEWKKIHD